MTYQEQLKHPNWQKKRLEVLECYGFECSNCGTKEKQLHVHHLKYQKGKKAWEYPLSNFDCLCEDCHKKAHDQKQELDYLLSHLGPFGLGHVIGYLKAIVTDYTPEEFKLNSHDEFEGASDFFRINVGIPANTPKLQETQTLQGIAKLVHGCGMLEGPDSWEGYRLRRGQK